MHQRLPRAGNVEQRIALRRDFAEPAADQHDQVGCLDARQQLRIDAEADVAGVARMQRVDQVGAAERGRDRHVEALGEARERSGRGLRPAAAADEHDRRLRGPQKLLQFRHVGEAGPGLDRLEGRRVRHRDPLDQHVLRQRHHHRPGPAVAGGVERARDDLGDTRRIVDLGRPFRHGAEHRAVVEFLERLAVAHLAPDLADEHDQRRRVLLGDVDAGRGVGGAGAAGAEHHTGPAGDLADGLRHHGGAALLAADGELDRPVVEGVERREIALARHAEHVLHAVDDELVDQDFAAGAGAVIGAQHFFLLGLQPSNISQRHRRA